MRRKKTAALVLSSAMLFTAMLGLAGCGGDNDDNKPTTVDPKDPSAQGVTLRDDNRTKAYVSYDKDGNKLGEHTTLAAAINTAVDNDAENEEFGGYVTKAGGTRHLFTNRAGYTEENSDMFWYYEDGTKLDSMFCWDNVNSLAILQNTNYITHEVSSFGTKSMQSWNSYGLLDLNGQQIPAETQSAQSYELSSTMDAGMLAFPKRLNGITKQVYNIDLSNVKITPPYKGGDPVYAFMGFYSWQDYYVVDLGIACDVTTGNWYPFEATSRDNSFSDANYNIDDKCVMTSTWDKAGGYFVPDTKNISMSIETQLLTDDDGDTYQSNYLVIKDGADNMIYSRRIEEDTIRRLFPGAKIGKENTYIFNAGLDIKNENALSDGVNVKNVDYFNGAKFENLTITEATAYFPKVEEMSDKDYGFVIEEDLRGNTYSILLADNTKNTPTSGVYDYVILNNNLCSSYAAKDGYDVYSFSFDHVPVADDEFGTNLKVYQDMIDSLKGITSGEIASKIEEIQSIRENIYENADNLQRYHGLLDFTPYLEANEKLLEAMNLSEAGKKVAADFNALTDISNYKIKGLTTDGTEIAGYLYNEIEKFKTIKEAYNGLEDVDKERIAFHIEMKKFEKWDKFSAEIATTKAAAEAVTAKIKLGKNNTTAVKDWTEQTAAYALDELIFWSMAVKGDKGWDTDKGENDGANTDPTNGHGVLMDFDHNAYPSIRIVLCKEFLDANEVALPEYVKEVLEAIGYDDFYEGAYYPIYGTVQTAMQIHNNTWLNDKALEAFLNDVWAPDYVLSGQISWNWNTGAKFESYYSARTKFIADIAGGTLTYTYVDDKDGNKEKTAPYKTYMYFDLVGGFLADTLGFEIKDNGWGIKEGTISLGAEESAAALAVAAKMNALGTLDATYEVKGWEAPAGTTDVKGYYYSEILAYRVAADELNALSARERLAALGKANATNWAAWGKESDALAAIVANEKYTATASIVKLADMPTGTTYTERNPEYALKQLTYWANRISLGSTWSADENGDSTNPEKSKVCDWDNNAYPSIRVAVLANFLQNELELTLTPYMTELLKTVKSQEFYDNYYYIVSETALLAKSITDGNKTKITDLSADQLAFVSKYFTVDYNGTLKSGFASFNQWQSGRALKGIVKYVGAEITGKTDVKGYFDVVNKFLTDLGYTADTNWGVKESVLVNKDLSVDVLQVVNIITSINDISGNTAVYNGWKAPNDARSIKGYLGDELEAYRAYKVELAKLDATKQAAVKAEFKDSMLTAWDAFEAEMTALQANDALKNLAIKAVRVTGDLKTFTGEEAMADLLAALLATSRGEMYITGDDANSKKVSVMNSDNTWMQSFFACFLIEKFNEAGVTLPKVINDLLAQVEYNSGNNGVNFVHDFKYIYNVASLAEKITNGTASQNAFLNVVNNYMVGFNTFKEGGLAWNFNASQGQDFLYRSKMYVSYFGFGKKAAQGDTPEVPAKTLAQIVKIVTDELKDVELVKYGNADTAYTVNLGVKSAITAANLKNTWPEGEVIPDPLPDSETVLPETAAGWEAGADMQDDAKKNVTVVKVGDGYKFVSANAADAWSFAYRLELNKKLNVADGQLVYDLTSTGKVNLVIYGQAKDGGNKYAYITDFNDMTKHEANGKGTISASDLLAKFVSKYASDYSADDETFTIAEIYVYIQGGSELNIRTLGVIGEVEEKPVVGEGYVNVLPEAATGWNKDNMGDTATVTVTDGAHKIDASAHTGDLEYSANLVVNKKISVENGAIFYDLATTGGACDIVLYIDEGPVNGAGGHYVYFSNFGLTTDSFTGKGVITGKQILAALIAKSNNKWGYAADTAELTVCQIRVRSGAGSVLTVNDLYLGEQVNVLPEAATGWNKDNMGDTATVTVTDGAHKIDASAHTGDLEYSANLVVNGKISAENGAIYYDLATTGGACDIVLYVKARGDNSVNNGNGHYVYFSNFGLTTDSFTGKGVITAQQILDQLVAKRASWGYTAETVAAMTELEIAEFRIRSGAGSVLTVNELALTTVNE